MQDGLRGYRRIIGKHWGAEPKNQTCRTGKSRIAMARRPDAGKKSPPKSERLRGFSGEKMACYLYSLPANTFPLLS